MRQIVVFLLLVVSIVTHGLSQERSKYINSWLSAGTLVSKYAWPNREPFVKLIHYLVQKNNETTNTQYDLSNECSDSLTSFANHLSNEDESAMLLFDSFAKVSPGFLSERLQDFGHYSQCLTSNFNKSPGRYILLSIDWPKSNEKDFPSRVTWRFTTSDFEKVTKEQNYNINNWIGKFNKNADFFAKYPQLLAICLPSICTKKDIKKLLINLEPLVTPLKINLYSSETTIEDSFPHYNGSKVQIISRIILILLVSLSLTSSILCNLVSDKWKNTFLGHFDIKSHTVRLFSFPDSAKIRTTEFISGYKGLYLITGMTNHAYMPLTPAIGFHYIPIHSLEINDPFWNSYQKAMATFNINVAVSAMLNSISWIDKLEKSKGKFTFALFMLLRILRTLPITLVCLLLMYSFPLLPSGSGPLVDKAQQFMLTNCLNNGWKELLFVSNYQKIEEICYPVGWYLSADLQLYALSYLPLIALAIKPKIGYILLTCQVIIGIFSEAFVINLKQVYPALPMMNIPSLDGVFRSLTYTHSWTHNYLACYAIGLAGGYFIVRNDQYKMNINRIIKISIVILLFMIPSYVAMKNYDGCVFKYSRIYEIVLASVFRATQSISFVLFSFILSYFPTSIVSRFLSNPILILSSRMSFSMFMIHPVVMALLFSTRMDTDYSRSYYTMFILYVFAVSFILGYFMVVFVEYPFDSLLRSTLKSLMTKKQQVQGSDNKSQLKKSE